MSFILNPALKMSHTDTHVFFLNGPFSQWYPCEFEQHLDPHGKLIRFNCAEQFMMAGKAFLFDDDETMRKIMAVQQEQDWRKAPEKQKALGRQITPFNSGIWEAVAREIVYLGNIAKFSQNENLRKFLLDTGDKVLVEGSRVDRIWGVGISWDDPAIKHPENWLGTNWLGETLMRVRQDLRSMS